jgi:hypothetical protein
MGRAGWLPGGVRSQVLDLDSQVVGLAHPQVDACPVAAGALEDNGARQQRPRCLQAQSKAKVDRVLRRRKPSRVGLRPELLRKRLKSRRQRPCIHSTPAAASGSAATVRGPLTRRRLSGMTTSCPGQSKRRSARPCPPGPAGDSHRAGTAHRLRYTADGLVLLLGETQARTPLPWQALEQVPDLLRGQGWVLIGSAYSTGSTPGSLDAHLKAFLKRDRRLGRRRARNGRRDHDGSARPCAHQATSAQVARDGPLWVTRFRPGIMPKPR